MKRHDIRCSICQVSTNFNSIEFNMPFLLLNAFPRDELTPIILRLTRELRVPAE